MDERIEPALKALKDKIRFIRHGLAKSANLHLKFDAPEQALQQAVFSRGDRRLAPVLLEIGTGRASFKQAMRVHDLDPWWYAVRPRGQDELLCWEVVDHGLRPGYLWQDYTRAKACGLTRPCEPAVCRRCGVCGVEHESA